MSLRHLFLLPLAFTAMASAAEPYKIAGKVTGAGDGPWDYAYVDAANRRLLVARGDGVMAMDLDSEAVTPVFVPGKRVHGIVTTPSGMGVSSNGDSSSASVFKAADGKVIAEIPAGAKADAVVRDPKSGLVLVMNSKDGTVTFVDADKGKAAGDPLTVGGVLEFAAADKDGHVFVNVEDKNELVVIDVAARQVTARHPLTDCDSPTGLALDDDSHVLVASCANGHAAALSALDGHSIATLPIGKGPDAVMFDGKRKRFLVPCGEGVLTVIEEGAGGLSVLGSVTTERGARTGAVDSKTGKIYLPTADFAPAEPGKRPAALPGSFHILVLSQN